MTNKLGVTDTPRPPEDDNDLIGTDPYARGLVSFIAQCPTPMSIAIQGDWGSGKTSVINFLKKSVEEQGYQTAMVNTWQFSKLDSDRLFESIVYTILDDLGSKSRSREKLTKIGKSLLKITTSTALALTGISPEALTQEITNYEESIRVIKKLHDNFSEAIREILSEQNKNKLILFIDDLDRLNPGAAVELLEAFKLFMDVEGCVFVLAVDYDVVVQGVREKYGQNMPLKKCRSFFDKIIQVPFHMPVERYDLTKMVQTYLGNRLGDSFYLNIVSEYATKIIGKNPRSMKRMVNAFHLIDLIHQQINNGNNTEKDYDTILFCILCIQIQLPELYDYISETDSEQWSSILEDDAMRDDVKKSLYERLDAHNEESERNKEAELLVSAIGDLIDLLSKLYENDKTKHNDRFSVLATVLELSSVTGRDEGTRKKRKPGDGRASTTDHVLRVINYLAEKGSFDNRTYGLATKAVAEQDNIGQSTVQSQCTRSLGFKGVNEFLTSCNDFLTNKNDNLYVAMSTKVTPHAANEIKEELNKILVSYGNHISV